MRVRLPACPQCGSHFWEVDQDRESYVTCVLCTRRFRVVIPPKPAPVVQNSPEIAPSPTPLASPWMTLEEAAIALGVSASGIYHRRRNGLLRSQHDPQTGHPVVSRADVERAIALGLSHPAVEPGVCQMCQRVFPRGTTKGRFCSDACRMRLARQRARLREREGQGASMAGLLVHCYTCRRTIPVESAQDLKRRWCSDTCHAQWRQRRKEMLA